MCGPIAAYASHKRAGGTLRYQVGRGSSYAAAGAIVGFLGQPVVRILWDSNVTTALSWALALLLAMAAYRAWPRAKAKAKAPASEQGLVQITPRDGAKPGQVSWILRILRRFPAQPALLGALSVLIPCGALWGGLVLAASSGSALAGGLAMIAFSLTSGSGLLASSFLSRRLRQRSGHHRLLALVFALGAVFLVLRPIAMHVPATSTGDTDQAAAVHCPLHPGGMP
jgi:hypothetical protein